MMKELVFKNLTTKGQTVAEIARKIQRNHKWTNPTKRSVQNYLELLVKQDRVKRSVKPTETGAYKWRKA